MLKQLIKLTNSVLIAFSCIVMASLCAHAATPVTPHGTARFQTNTATINVTQNSSRYQAVWTRAVQAWNRTGAFTFQITNNSNAQVTTKMNPALGSGYSGMTYLTTDYQNYIINAECEINNLALRNNHYARFEWVNVAEHELGHAIGLNHNPGKASVMYASNRSYSIQRVDIEGVNQLYAGSPAQTSLGMKSKQIIDPVADSGDIESPTVDPETFGIIIERTLWPVHYVDLAHHIVRENGILKRLAYPLYW
ncbi:matrixin family metalloprotease [Lentilactobacillus kefiri]|uniref:matrixin family metalloprotease n=1 Tax=Lentilactobacillus kefiri TaxID=33962 RepID=UPI0025A24526|nr:matrixin family metalloprotease [Lentilactobacillus kefiri]MDM7493630.1 matrixin family metalloprotease [Lentilactobacillus kefiri]